MTQTLLNLVADLELSLAAAASVGATTATLSTSADSDGVSLPTGKYGFTIDPDNSAKEFIICDLNGTALTNVQTVSMQGAVTSGFANYHRVGAVVTITDWAVLDRVLKNLTGETGFNNATPLNYDAEPSYADPLTIPTVQYVLDTVNGGTVTFDRQIITGDAGENVSAGDWVYFNTTDGEWYKTDADDTAKCLNVRIGKAIGAGTDGLPIAGGIFVSGTETVGTYVAGTTYYLSNTAGALATSAGTNSVVVGVGDGNGDLILRQTTPNQNDALVGTSGTPSNANKFVTSDDVSDVAGSGKIIRASGTGLPNLLTNAVKLLSSSGVETNITNTVTETNVFSVSVPANTLGTTKGVRVTVYISDNSYENTNATLTLRLKYGATTVTSVILDPGAAVTNLKGTITCYILGSGATSSQTGGLLVNLSKEQLVPDSTTQVAFARSSTFGSASEDSTTALNLILSAQWATASTASDFQYDAYVIETLM